MFAGCRATLGDGDIVFGQLETTVTDRGARSPNARLAMRAPSATAAEIHAAGYDVMSFAGNHCLDWGYEGFFDTLEHLAAASVQLCGAGPSIHEARAAAIVRHGRTRIAFIACSSILPEGYRATEHRAGCMPMRAHTIYEQIEHDQPGTPARVVSHPHRGDLDALLEAIRLAAADADVVIVSIHWGIHMAEAVIADYQETVAHAAIDAGAHAIIGHHPHILKGVEIYRGAPVFYSLGNFAIEQPQAWDPGIVDTESFRHLMSLNPDRDPAGLYALPHNTRKTGIARLVAGTNGIERVEFIPAWIDDNSVPHVLDAADDRFDDVCRYLQKISADAGFDTTIEPVSSCLRITPGESSASRGGT
jgi:poly-gamma-glutamate synthesis protein (capsule biosynthesis protein)